jgi:hypothetical protein
MIRSIQNWNNQDKPIEVRVLEKKLTSLLVLSLLLLVSSQICLTSQRGMHCTSYKIDPLIHPCLLNNSSPRFHFKWNGDLVK